MEPTTARRACISHSADAWRVDTTASRLLLIACQATATRPTRSTFAASTPPCWIACGACPPPARSVVDAPRCRCCALDAASRGSLVPRRYELAPVRLLRLRDLLARERDLGSIFSGAAASPEQLEAQEE